MHKAGNDGNSRVFFHLLTAFGTSPPINQWVLWSPEESRAKSVGSRMASIE